MIWGPTRARPRSGRTGHVPLEFFVPAPLSRTLVTLAVLLAVVATATIVVFSSGGDHHPRAAAVTTVAATPTPASATPVPAAANPAPVQPAAVTAVAVPGGSVSVRAEGGVNVRSGPGLSFPVVASLAGGVSARAAGRDAAGEWLLLDRAGGGWVSASVVDVSGDVLALPVSGARTATPAPSAAARPSATATATPGRTPTPTATARASTTAAPSGLPDLVIDDAFLGAAGRLTLIIDNSGPGALVNRAVEVTATDPNGVVLFRETTIPLTIPAGGAVNVELPYQPVSRATIIVTVNADGSIREVSTANNRRQVTVNP